MTQAGVVTALVGKRPGKLTDLLGFHGHDEDELRIVVRIARTDRKIRAPDRSPRAPAVADLIDQECARAAASDRVDGDGLGLRIDAVESESPEVVECLHRDHRELGTARGIRRTARPLQQLDGIGGRPLDQIFVEGERTLAGDEVGVHEPAEIVQVCNRRLRARVEGVDQKERGSEKQQRRSSEHAGSHRDDPRTIPLALRFALQRWSGVGGRSDAAQSRWPAGNSDETRAGTPAQTTLGGTSVATAACAPTSAPRPTRCPGMTVALAPSSAPSSR